MMELLRQKEQEAMVTLPGDLTGRVVDRVRQMVCGLHGHDSLLHFERDRMYLRCVSCGHETPGWELNEEAQNPVSRTAAARAEAAAQPLAPPHPVQLISERRVA
jgi:hypothetical protein